MTPIPSKIIEIPLGLVTKVFLIQGEEGAVLVDAGNPGQSELILAALEVHGVTPEEIKLILITHGHTDHFGSAKALREATGAPVAVHAADAPALRAGANPEAWNQPTGQLIGFLMGLGLHFPDAGEEAALEPDETFDAAWRLDDYGVAAEVIPTPGHTPGSVTVLLDNGEAIVGDLLMSQMLSRRPAPPMVAWDLERNWETLRALLAREPQRFYITHGRALSLAQVRAFVARLDDATVGRGLIGWLMRYHTRRDTALLAAIQEPARRKVRLTRLSRYRAWVSLILLVFSVLLCLAIFFLPLGVQYITYLLLLSGVGYLGLDFQIKLLKALAQPPQAPVD